MGDLAGGAAAILLAIEHRFDSAGMTGPDPDRVRYAQIAGAAARHAQAWLTARQETAAVAELAQAAAGRADLLAECAGTAPGDVVAVTAVAREGSGVCLVQGC